MQLKHLLLFLAAPLLALGKVVVTSSSYSNGIVHLDVQTYTDAPGTYNIVLVSSDGTTKTLLSGVQTQSGVADIALPPVSTGSYKIELTSTDESEIFSTTPTFDVDSSDFGSTPSFSAASYSISVTGSARPFVTHSLLTDASGHTTLAAITINQPTESGLPTLSVAPTTTPISTIVATPTPIPSESVYTSYSLYSSGSVVQSVPVVQSAIVTVTPSPSSTTASGSGAATATLHSTTKSGAVRGVEGRSGVVVGLVSLVVAVVVGAGVL